MTRLFCGPSDKNGAALCSDSVVPGPGVRTSCNDPEGCTCATPENCDGSCTASFDRLPNKKNADSWVAIASFFDSPESAVDAAKRQRENRLNRAARARRGRYQDQV